jgi:CRISPR/Cas system-associated exonuclease Cas4 (RecB family)
MFEILPYPEFSWSISRQRKLDDCPRAYFFHYYAAHNGWLREAPVLAKQTYRLKQLTSIDMILGHEMDDRAREIEAALRAGRPMPKAEELEERTRETLRGAYKTSKRRRADFELKPKSVVMLRSFYLDDEEPSEREVTRVQERLPTCIRYLLAAPDWERVKMCGQDGCVKLADFMTFTFEGITVFAMPDFAYVHENRLYVIDWKTGEYDPGHEAQPLLSAFCLGEQHPDLRDHVIEPVLYYLSSGERRVIPLPADLGDYVAETVLAGISSMRKFMRDPAENAPLDMGEFPRRESGLCQTCSYVQLCERNH